MSLKLTPQAITAIAESTSEHIFKALHPYRIKDEDLQHLAMMLDDAINELLSEQLPVEEG